MRALVLSGGGAKGAFQVGALRSLLDENPKLDYDVYAGVSVGALNSSLLATGLLNETLPKLEKMWLHEVKGNSSIWRHHLWYYILAGIIVISLFIILAFISFIVGLPKWLTILFGLLAVGSFYVPYFSLNNTHSIYSTNPLRELVYDNLDLNMLRNSGKQLIVGAVSFTTGQYKSVSEDDANIVDWILASSAFPIFFPLVEIDGEYWTDGGVLEIAPLTDVIRMGATEVDIILASPIDAGQMDGEPGLLKQFQRHINIMSSEVLRNDLDARCSLVNGIKIRVIMPKNNLTSNSLDFNSEKIANMYEEGRRVAKQQLDI